MKDENANEKVQSNISPIGSKLESLTVSATACFDSCSECSESVSGEVENLFWNLGVDTMPVCFRALNKSVL